MDSVGSLLFDMLVAIGTSCGQDALDTFRARARALGYNV